MTAINVTTLAPDDVPDQRQPVTVRAVNGDLFKVRRVGNLQKRHHYEVWSALAWEQHPLTKTNWRPCTDFFTAVELINRYGVEP